MTTSTIPRFPSAARFMLAPASLLAFASCGASAATVPAALVGEWFSGPQYAASVYTTDFGGANGDARRLLLDKNGSYVFTEFESTYYPSSFGFSGYPITCQMMDVTVERGTFSVQGDKITFKAAKIERVGAYSPNRLNNGCKRNAGTKTSKAAADVSSSVWAVANGKLTFKSGDGSAAYVRRTPPTPPTPTPPASTPSSSGSTTNGAAATPPVNSAPTSKPSAPPAKWTATGAWNATLTVAGKTFKVVFNLQDDSPRILGYGDDPVEYANGNSETGALDVGLDVDGRTMQLKVTGRFDGDRYTGDVRWTNYEGEDLGRGTLVMTRR